MLFFHLIIAVGAFLAPLARASALFENATYGDGLAKRATFTNPIHPSLGADPCMRYVGGYYYLTSTQNTDIKMWKASTIAGLKTATAVTVYSDTTAGRNFHFWAPEFWYLNGRWYIYYAVATASDDATHRMYVLQGSTDANNPIATYTFVGSVQPSNRANDWAVDGSILQYGGALYFVFSSFSGDLQCLWINRMSSPTALSGEAAVISCPDYAWEKVGGNVNEGPEAVTYGGTTRIVYSGSYCGGSGYALGLLTLTGSDPMLRSSWTKYGSPIFQSSAANSVYGPGHNFMFQAKGGAWYHAYHGHVGPSESCGSTRTTRVQPMTWESNRPVFGTPVALGVAVTEP